MKTIFVLRHAKSSWSEPDLADFDRPLNERGKMAAPFMGKLMREKGLAPDIIISSTALRAKNTAELVKEAGELSAPIWLEARIYEASPGGLRRVVAELDDSVESAMIVGHNPGVEGFIRFLTGQVESMSTAALAISELEIDKWEEITEGCGKLQNVFRPKDEMRRVLGNT